LTVCLGEIPRVMTYEELARSKGLLPVYGGSLHGTFEIGRAHV